MKQYITLPAVMLALMGIAFLCMVYGLLGPYEPRDDSDGPTENSHMEVFTDHLTGCQYLYRGSLTPRMDRTGKQVCK